MNLLLDTGSTTTTILPALSKNLGIDFSKLKKSTFPCTTAKGDIYPHVLPHVKLTIICNNLKNDYFICPMDYILCLKPSRSGKISNEVINFPICLLGMDILRLFTNWRWNYATHELFLEP